VNKFNCSNEHLTFLIQLSFPFCNSIISGIQDFHGEINFFRLILSFKMICDILHFFEYASPIIVYSYKMSTLSKRREDKSRSKALEDESLNTCAYTTPSTSPVKKRKSSGKAKKPKVNTSLLLYNIIGIFEIFD
jgi:hypothetical protein